MRLKQLYLESISHFDEAVQDMLIREAPHTLIDNASLPPEFGFLRGIADLGFENLGLSKDEWTTLGRAFVGEGIRCPGTPYRLRYDRQMHAVIEAAEGAEPSLPPHWKRAVLVVNGDGVPTWIGDLVRPDQLASDHDFGAYTKRSDGWTLNR